MIEINYKDQKLGKMLINVKNISLVSYSQESNKLTIFTNNLNQWNFHQNEIEENLSDIYKRIKILFMR